MRLDHVSYAVSSNELVDTVQRLGQQLGGSFVDGGRHPRFGTRNFVLPLEGAPTSRSSRPSTTPRPTRLRSARR